MRLLLLVLLHQFEVLTVLLVSLEQRPVLLEVPEQVLLVPEQALLLLVQFLHHQLVVQLRHIPVFLHLLAVQRF